MIIAFAVGIGLVFAVKDKEHEKQNYQGREVQTPYSVENSNEVRVKKLSERLPTGLWEITVDSSVYLIYVSGTGNAMLKK